MSIIRRAQNLHWLGALLACLPVLLFFVVVIRNTVNLPMLDDYNAVLRFTETFGDLHGAIAKGGYILSAQHNEYKLVFQHLVYALEVESTGHLNFIFLQQLGNLFIPLTAVCLWFLLPKEVGSLTDRVWIFVPVCFLLFAPTYQETLDNSMQGLANIPVLPSSLAAIILLHRNRFSLACMALVLSIATLGNGFFAAVAGALLLLQQQHRRRLFTWIALTSACAGIYAFHYKPARIVGVISTTASLRNLLLFPFVFLGSLASHVAPALLLGLLLVIVFIALTHAGWRRANPAAFYAVIFVLITALAVDGTRHVLSLSLAASSRYRLYSLLFLILLYYGCVQKLLLLRWTARKPAWIIFTAVSILFCLRADRVADRVLLDRNLLLIRHARQWLADPSASVIPNEEPSFRTPEWAVTLHQANEVLQTSIDKGIYVPPYHPWASAPVREGGPAPKHP